MVEYAQVIASSSEHFMKLLPLTAHSVQTCQPLQGKMKWFYKCFLQGGTAGSILCSHELNIVKYFLSFPVFKRKASHMEAQAHHYNIINTKSNPITIICFPQKSWQAQRPNHLTQGRVASAASLPGTSSPLPSLLGKKAALEESESVCQAVTSHQCGWMVSSAFPLPQGHPLQLNTVGLLQTACSESRGYPKFLSPPPLSKQYHCYRAPAWWYTAFELRNQALMAN